MVSAGHVPTHQTGPLAAVVLLLDGVMGEGGADGGGGALELRRGGTRGHGNRLLQSKLPTSLIAFILKNKKEHLIMRIKQELCQKRVIEPNAMQMDNRFKLPGVDK